MRDVWHRTLVCLLGSMCGLWGCATHRAIERDFHRALAEQRAQRHDEALRGYRQLLARHPDLDGAWHNLAILYLQRGRPAQAATAFFRAIGANADNLRTRYLLVISLFESTYLPRARAQLRALEKRHQRLLHSVTTRHGVPDVSRLPDPWILSRDFSKRLAQLRHTLRGEAGRRLPLPTIGALFASAPLLR